MSKIYTAEDLASMTGIPALPEFIAQRKAGFLAICDDFLKLEKPLENIIKHKPSPSRGEIRFDRTDHMTLSFMFQGIGYDVSFESLPDNRFKPVRLRHMVEDGRKDRWAVAEIDLSKNTGRYYASSMLMDFDDAIPSDDPELAKKFEAAVFADMPKTSNKPVSPGLLGYIKLHADPAKLDADAQVEYVCEQIKNIGDLSAGESLNLARVALSDSVDSNRPENLRLAYQLLSGTYGLQSMVLRSGVDGGPSI